MEEQREFDAWEDQENFELGRTKENLTFKETQRIGRLEDQGEFDFDRNTENWTLGGPRRI